MKNTTMLTNSAYASPVGKLKEALDAKYQESQRALGEIEDVSAVALDYMNLPSLSRQRVFAFIQAEASRKTKPLSPEEGLIEEFYGVVQDLINGVSMEETQERFGMHTSQYQRYEHEWKMFQQMAGGRCFAARRKDPPVKGATCREDLDGRCYRCGGRVAKR